MEYGILVLPLYFDKVPKFASMHASTHLSLNLYVNRIQSWPARISQNRAVVCARGADSNLSLKDQIAKLHNMELVQGNEEECDETDDDESLA